MLNKDSLKPWIVDALLANEGSADVVQIAKHIWAHHERELRDSGDMFFKWQYEFPWSGQILQKEGKIVKGGPAGVWVLKAGK